MYQNPYEILENGSWIKTNFHTHAGTGPNTCGSNSIDSVTELYRRLGYGALCISNHDLFTDTTARSDEEIFFIPGVEYSQDEHMLTIGVNQSLHTLPHQEAINEANRQNGFVILCHPNWMRKEYWPWEKAEALHGYAGIEIMNTLIYRLRGSGRATDTWDHLLQQGKLVFGFGNDDFHFPFDAGRCWTDIYAKEKNYASIKEAIDCGRFVASTGLCLADFKLVDNCMHVQVKHSKETYVQSFCYRFISEKGLVKETCGEFAQYQLQGEKYVRVEAIAENGAMLFTQPVYDTSFFKKT